MMLNKVHCSNSVGKSSNKRSQRLYNVSREILLKFIALCNDLSNNLLSNTTDDTWLSLFIIYIVLIVTLC